MITSVANPTIKHIRALRNRKTRSETGQYFVEGIRLVAEAIQVGAPVDRLVVAPDLLTSRFAREVVAQAQAGGIPILEVSPAVFVSISDKDGPQGLGAVLHEQWVTLDSINLDVIHAGSLCLVALVSPQDPGNIGTILRTCDAVGARPLVLLDDSADPYDPNALRASMGALFAVPLCRAAFGEFVGWARRAGCSVLGTSDAAPQDYQAVSYPAPLALIMGSEREGLSTEQHAACDIVVSLPMIGRSDSLNLAVATGVMLYEIFSRRRALSRE